MNRFCYRAYYEYKPSKSDPLCSPKSEEDVAFALARFPDELPYFLSDTQATVSTPSPQPDPKSSHLVVITDLDETTIDKAVAKCLDGLGLFADKLPNRSS